MPSYFSLYIYEVSEVNTALVEINLSILYGSVARDKVAESVKNANA